MYVMKKVLWVVIFFGVALAVKAQVDSIEDL